MAALIFKPPNSRLRTTLLRLLSFGVLLIAAKHFLFRSLVGDRPPLPLAPKPYDHHLRLHFYSSVFQDLISDGFLAYNSRSLCLGTVPGDGVLAALHQIGVSDSLAVPATEVRRLPFDSESFDFEFAAEGLLDRAVRPVEIAAELGRSLKPGGFLVVHTKSANDPYSLNSLLDLFDCCTLISKGEIVGLGSIPVREIVMKKERVSGTGSDGNNCSDLGFRRELQRSAESALRRPLLNGKRRNKVSKNDVKYLSSMVDISFKNRYVYVDVGAGSYDSSIGGWFVKDYPKQNKRFEIFAVEPDESFRSGYGAKKEVILLPVAAWVRNETLFFKLGIGAKRRKVEERATNRRRESVVPTALYVVEGAETRGFDFAEWLRKSVSQRDFVVVKMDVEGSEFYLIPRLVETGAICLVDEIFLECHYDRIKRRVKYRRTYEECLRLFRMVRERGVLVHQWWW